MNAVLYFRTFGLNQSLNSRNKHRMLNSFETFVQANTRTEKQIKNLKEVRTFFETRELSCL